jgi:diguanylate cyclase (GGDEF)-like protein
MIAGGAAIFGILATVLVAIRDRRRLAERLNTLEDILRRIRASDPENQFDERPQESPLQLSRERLLLQNLLDRFPEVTQKFVLVENVEELCRVQLAAFTSVLGTTYGAVFVRDGDRLTLMAQTGLEGEDLPEAVRIGEGRIGHAALKCLILRPGDFATLNTDERLAVEHSRKVTAEFDFYVPLVYRGDAIGCVAVGGMKRVVQKSHSVCMALANLGSVVLTNIQRANKIRILSEEDPLTRLSNRRHCLELLAERLKTRNEQPFALLLFDVDHFKLINDQHGHGVGDNVLRLIADTARDLVDESNGEFACRFGGDEHLCVLNVGDISDLATRVEEFRGSVKAIKVEVAPDQETPAVHITGGVSFCPAEEEEIDALIALADRRLYSAKEAGRDRIVFESSAARAK